MKRLHQSLLLLFMAVYFVLAGTTRAFSSDRNMRVMYLYNTAPSLYITDTLPKAAAEAAKKTADAAKKAATDAAKKAVPPKVDGNLFKKIADMFRFRKNARESEKKRVLEIFESLGVNDSIAASSENIKLLIDELSVRENQHYDTLIAIITEIRNAGKHVPADKPNAAQDTVPPEPSESKVVTDKDIEDLTNKLLPLISEKVNEDKSDSKKREALKALRKLRFGANEVQYLTDTAKGIIKPYRLTIKNKAEVYGIYNYNSTNDDDYKFGYLNSIIYNALFINGKTGDIKNLNGWDQSQVITDAQKAGCNVIFTAAISQPASVASFLGNQASQKKFVDNAIYLLKLRRAKGVNISFTDIPSQERDRFSVFIKFLSEVLKVQDSTYKVLITIPAYDRWKVYDLAYLSNYADHFIVDFTKLDPASKGPIAPLRGKADYTIETSISRYLNEDVAPEKLVVSLPYSGAKWQIGQNGDARFIQYNTYSEIRNRYNWPVYYDEMSGNAVMDSLNSRQVPVRSIWYDDEVSLGGKYDYILENGLGGVSVNALGYDKGFGELWDMLAYKFAVIDTVFQKDSLLIKHVPADLGFIDRLKRKMALYWYILKNPCEICFEDIKDPAYRDVVYQYLADLRVDSLINDANKKRPLDKRFISRFEYINHELTSFLGLLTLVFLLLGLICGGIYIYQIKVNSVEWKWKKYGEITLIVVAVFFILFFFAYLFTNDSIPLFGATPAKSPAAVIIGETSATDTIAGVSAATPLADESADTLIADIDTSTACVTDPSTTCINMPLPTLMAIILAGMIAGLLLTRYLIMPLLKRNDIP
ncbi:glycoside hydrolase family 18 protein [Sediminibacterium ginsengisoli]|uniref:chitinase n=1 Tax=Sediminibacterium ginsengisoli TaxID=413434 RepID=A0A1T4PLX1_9BACT|nr:glycoside hydrolase family 18 protein [Sediminibacterium ginsengisoli]SJZ92492.1 Glycosyl hydrolases family 18 [Sediminibacterium ginsengisoli]